MSDLFNPSAPPGDAGGGGLNASEPTTGGGTVVIIRATSKRAYTELGDAGFVTVIQGEALRVYGEVSITPGTLTIAEPPTYKVYDSLGFGGIEPAQTVDEYDTAAAGLVRAAVVVSTASVPPGLYRVVLRIKGTDEAGLTGQYDCRLMLDVRAAT